MPVVIGDANVEPHTLRNRAWPFTCKCDPLQLLIQPFVTPQMRPHQALPELAMVWDHEVKQLMNYNVLTYVSIQLQQITIKV